MRQRLALELHRALCRDLRRDHPLKVLFWECTLRCNMHCLHCGSDCKQAPASPDMPAADFLKVIAQVAPYFPEGTPKPEIVFTGGEALMRSDLEAVGLLLNQAGFAWGLVTNGLLLTAERYQSLKNSGMGALTLSLDGFEAAHNWLRGVPQAYAGACRALDVLLADASGEVNWDVVTCVHARNLDTLPAFKTWLLEKGVRQWRLFTVFPSGRAAGNPELSLSSAQWRTLMDFIAQTRQEQARHQHNLAVSYGCEGFLGAYEGRVRDSLFCCQAGLTIGSVLIDGSISACPSIRADFHQGSIYKDNFMDVWQNRFEAYRDRGWTRAVEPCASCKQWRFCQGNGMHLWDDAQHLKFCHYKRLFR